MAMTRKGLLSRRTQCLLMAVGVVACCYALCFAFSGMIYLTNDDMLIQAALSGMRTGTPYLTSYFVNVLITVPIALLYGALPSVQWWYVYGQALMAIGMVLVNYAVNYVVSERTPPERALALAATAAFDAAWFIYPVSKLGFTIVPGVLGAGVVAFMLADERARTIPGRIACIFLAILALAHREESGLVVLCYVFLALFATSVLDEQTDVLAGLRRCIPTACVIAGIAAVVVIGNHVVQAQVNGEDFEAYNNARSALLDYPHDSYEENPELYEAVDWDEDLYRLAMNWCLMDERVNTQNLTYLANNGHVQTGIATMGSQWEVLLEHAVAPFVLLTWIGLTLLALPFLLATHKYRACVLWLLNTTGTIGVVLLQVYLGRILYRTVMVALVPSMAFDFVLVASVCQGLERRAVLSAYLVLSMIGGIPAAWAGAKAGFDKEWIAERQQYAQKIEALQQYAATHKDNVYIQGPGIASSTNPWKVYPNVEDRPTNVIIWGGSEFNSHLFKTRVALNGLPNFDGSVFGRENVYLVSGSDLEEIATDEDQDSIAMRFLRWQHNRYGAVAFTDEEQVCPGVNVIKVSYEDVEGLHFELEDGQLRRVDSDENDDDAEERDDQEGEDSSGEDDQDSAEDQ